METINFTLRMSEETLRKIKLLATDEGLTITDYLLSKGDPQYLENQEILKIPNVLERLDSIPKGKVFSLRSLFEEDQWVNFSRGSRIATGRLFFQSYEKQLYDLQNKIKFIGKTSSNLAQYKRI